MSANEHPGANVVVLQRGHTRWEERSRHPTLDDAKAAVQAAAGADPTLEADPINGGWTARAGRSRYRIMSPGQAARFLEMGGTTGGGTTDLPMNARRPPHEPE